ncbi:MAG: hypothetical protein ACRDEA_19855 [Microcystaceae cyanobacterium]
MDKNDEEVFPVDGQLLMILPRAGASLRNPDVQLPTLRTDASGHYLEMRVEPDSGERSEVAVIRRVPIEDLCEEEWKELKTQCASLDLSVCADRGISKGLEKIKDPRIQRLLVALLTFLNPRQVAIVLFLYREAAKQSKSISIVAFRSNDLLESLGYSRAKDGSFPAKLRSQLNRDLVALHRTELVLAESFEKDTGIGAKVIIKSILRIKGYEIDRVPRDFDLAKAADYTYELADAYTVSLEFFEGPSRTGDYVLFSNSISTEQKRGNNAKNNYKMKLVVYLAGRIKWDKLTDEQYLLISKPYLLKNLDLLGSNHSRNSQILWRTIKELRDEGYILEARELPGKGKMTNIQLQINPEKLRCR